MNIGLQKSTQDNSTTKFEETPSEEKNSEPSPDGWTIAKSILREVGETIILTLMIFFLIQLAIQNFRVEGQSMAPNLQPGQYLVVDRISYQFFTTLQRGDVIVFTLPHRDDRDYVKRIIALPGEKVEMKQGQVFINNELLDETFGPDLDTSSLAPLIVPEEHVFVLGDNRNNSNDSRHWKTKTLDQDNIIGRAWLSYWPPKTWGVISRDEPSTSTTFSKILLGR